MHSALSKMPGMMADAVKPNLRILAFRDPDTTYIPRVAPLKASLPGDYDHLSRVREWSISGWGEEEEVQEE